MPGNQGGAVARALQGSGFHLRGLTRKPDSEHATTLARQGVEIVKGDLDDEVSPSTSNIPIGEAELFCHSMRAHR